MINNRNKILLLCDDLRFPSGVGTMARQIVLQTAHKYIWRQLSASVEHPEKGKCINISDAVNKEMNINNADILLYPINGYGDFRIVRYMLEIEKPDALMIFTDPRYFIWLFQMNHEIQNKIPIIYYTIWDNLPFPKFNRTYYQSCNALFAISKQTFNINKQVLGEDNVEILDFKNLEVAPKDKSHKQLLTWIPHGIDSKEFYKPDTEEELQEIKELRKMIFGEADADKIDFVVFFDSRNIQRKLPGNVVLSYRDFFRTLTREQQERTRIIFHCLPVDGNGTDIPAVINMCAPDIKVIFSPNPISPKQLNQLYAISDVLINCSNAEGWGLGVTTSAMTEKMFTATVTGGLQDQMGFIKEDGTYLDPDKDFNYDWGSNSNGKYKQHGEWCEPVFPRTSQLIGSPPTPAIFNDEASYEDFAVALRKIYDMPKEERERRGKLGREYMINEIGDAKEMGRKFEIAIDITLERFLPIEPFSLTKI